MTPQTDESYAQWMQGFPRGAEGADHAPYTAAGPFSWSDFLTTDRLRRAATDYSARYREEQQAIPAIRMGSGAGLTPLRCPHFLAQRWKFRPHQVRVWYGA